MINSLLHRKILYKNYQKGTMLSLMRSTVRIIGWISGSRYKLSVGIVILKSSNITMPKYLIVNVN